MPKAPEPKKTIYRNSDNGQIVKKEYAEKHPKTTEKERVKK
ncbi:multidrug transporter [Hymenobacter coccineus]|nr:multidrug transporter [Hymenobacter coccineus]